MKDYSPSIAPTVKGDRFNLNQCPKNDFKKEQMKNIHYASVVGERYKDESTNDRRCFIRL